MKHRSPALTIVASATALLTAWPADAQQAAGVDRTPLYAEAERLVEARGELARHMVDKLFSFSELGMREFETQRYLVGILRENGFTVEEGVAGIPTAWWATWSSGSGGPTIALGSDIDGIPKASQKPGVAYHDPLIEGAPGHGEGHNSGQPLNIVAALAVKEILTVTR